MKTPQILDIRDSITQAGIQSVDLASTISVPFTTITNRANIPNLASDLKVRFGVDRIMTQSIYQLQNEFGPNGEPVWAAVNDTFGQIRFVGSGWGNNIDSNGQYAGTTVVGDYVEITFYGTGLNLITRVGGTRSILPSVDGGSDLANICPASVSTILDSRNYSENTILSAIPTQTLGFHTVKLKLASVGFAFYGFEVLNTSSTLVVNPGSMLSDGKRLKLSTQQTPAYASGFTNSYGTAGARGGRVLVYMDKDGAIKKDIQYVDTAAAYLSSASHTNEDIIRTHYPREFGAGRSDDFSYVAPGGSANLAFTLDDGTTTLVGQSVGFANEGISVSTNNGFLTITFVGTGLDVERFDDATTAGPETQYTYSIDGVSQGSFGSTGSTVKRIQKIVSGLPYGTHTFRFSRGTPIYFTPRFSKFIVYGPKKPALPAGAVELADYNVMADYSPNTTVGTSNISAGVLRKAPTRELVYVDGASGTGPWGYSGGALTVIPAIEVGFQLDTNRNNGYFEYTFFGTGFELRTGIYTNISNNITVSLNGTSLNASYPGAASINVGTLGTGMTFGGASGTSFLLSTVASNVLNTNGGLSASGCAFRVWNLPLGKYTIRMTNNNNPNYLAVDALDVITPIHSPRSNLYADSQNTLPVGSCAISDNRKTSYLPVTAQKAWAQAVGITLNPTTTSASYVPCPDMSLTMKTQSGFIEIFYSALASNSSGYAAFQVYVNGVAVSGSRNMTGAQNQNVSDSLIVPVSAGTQKIDLYWRIVLAGTASVTDISRTLKAREL